MSSPVEQRPIPNDATLVWMASERAAPLFRTFDRARAFGPLVVVLAVLPPILATFADVMTTDDAAWGLRALNLTGSELPREAAAAVESAMPLEAVRSAALWLSAGLMRAADPARPVSVSLASLVGGAALLGLIWPLARSLSGRRFALWAVLLAAFHPTLTALLLDPIPVTAALAFAAAAFWGHLHLGGNSARAALAWLAVTASVAGSLALVGPVAATVPLVVAADAGFAILLGGAAEQRTGRGASGAGETALRRISAALVGIALWAALEGVIPDPVAIVTAEGALPGDFSDRTESIAPPVEAPVVGPLWGLAAIGLGRLLRIVHRRAAMRGPRPVPRLLLVWLAAAGGVALWYGAPAENGPDPAGRFALAHASIPVLLTAAYAIEEAARRMVSGAWVLLAVALPLAIRLGSLMAMVPADGTVVWVLLVVTAAVLAWVVAKVIPAIVSMPGLRRGALMGAVLVAVAVNSADGIALLFRPAVGDEAYRRLIRQLAEDRDAAAVVLLTDLSPPPELTFALRASFPDAPMEVAATWDEVAARLQRRFGPAPFDAAVAAWGSRGAAAATAADDLRPTGEPLLFAGRELLPYVFGREP